MEPNDQSQSGQRNAKKLLFTAYHCTEEQLNSRFFRSRGEKIAAGEALLVDYPAAEKLIAETLIPGWQDAGAVLERSGVEEKHYEEKETQEMARKTASSKAPTAEPVNLQPGSGWAHKTRLGENLRFVVPTYGVIEVSGVDFWRLSLAQTTAGEPIQFLEMRGGPAFGIGRDVTETAPSGRFNPARITKIEVLNNGILRMDFENLLEYDY